MTGARTRSLLVTSAALLAVGLLALYGGSAQAAIPSAATTLRNPLRSAKYRRSSGYGMRTHPITGERKLHAGLDMSAPQGTPIYAAADGTVEKIFNDSANGNGVKLRHPNGYATGYIHMASAPPVSVGQRVRQGDPIGVVGSTGRSTGPHLHFVLYSPEGDMIDPETMVDFTAW